MAIGACGCMKTNVLNRKESDADYSELMLNYISNKYDKKFSIIEAFFPNEGLDSTMKVNTLVVQENETGIIANVYAALANPYEYSDNYIDSRAGYLLKNRINTLGIDKYGKSKLYVSLVEEDYENIDISDENLNKLTLLVNINKQPTDDILKELFCVYEDLSQIDSKYTFMIVGFTEESEIFTKYVTNYAHYGKKGWKDYSGKVYATLEISERGLSYSDFINNCKKCE